MPSKRNTFGGLGTLKYLGIVLTSYFRVISVCRTTTQPAGAPVHESLLRALRDDADAKETARKHLAQKRSRFVGGVPARQDVAHDASGEEEAKTEKGEKREEGKEGRTARGGDDKTVWAPSVAAKLRAADAVWPVRWEKVEKQVQRLVALVGTLQGRGDHTHGDKGAEPATAGNGRQPVTHTTLSDAGEEDAADAASEPEEGAGEAGGLAADYAAGGAYQEDEDGVPWPLHERLEDAAKHPSVGRQWSERDVDWPDSRPPPQDPNAEVNWDEAYDPAAVAADASRGSSSSSPRSAAFPGASATVRPCNLVTALTLNSYNLHPKSPKT